MTVLTLKQLSAQRNQRPILNNLELSLKAGELLAIVGPNGAGKSTLLQYLAGVLPIETGHLKIQQQSTRHWNATTFARHLSYLPQLSRLTFPLTVQEVVRLGGLAHEWTEQQWQAKTQQSLEQWKLLDFAERDVRFLSGGEQQRIQLARSWLQMQGKDSAIWLLDEPFSALDLRHQQLALNNIQQLKQLGKSIVLVVHDLNFARHCADKVLLIKQGKKVIEGAPTEVLTEHWVREAFSVQVCLEQGFLRWW